MALTGTRRGPLFGAGADAEAFLVVAEARLVVAVAVRSAVEEPPAAGDAVRTRHQHALPAVPPAALHVLFPPET